MFPAVTAYTECDNLRSRTEIVMQLMHYTAIFEREEDGGYHVFVPALKGCHSQGDNLEEATANIREAIEVYVDSLKSAGEQAPIEDILVKPVEVAA